jgi:hypothetical protein
MPRQRKYFSDEERKEAQRKYTQRARERRRLGLTPKGKELGEKYNILRTFKLQGCVVCGEHDIACIDAHHIKDKKWEVAELLQFGTLQQLREELLKCVPLCSNCHRKLPFENFEKAWPSERRRKTCRKCRGK